MSTYPRTYDLIHADSVFTLYKNRWIDSPTCISNWYMMACSLPLVLIFTSSLLPEGVRWTEFCWRWTGS